MRILFVFVFLSSVAFGQKTDKQPYCDEIEGFKLGKDSTTNYCDTIFPVGYTGIVKCCIIESSIDETREVVKKYSTYKNGIKHGIERYWSDELGGFLYSEANYVNGKMDGIYRVWQDNNLNNLRYKQNYKNGKEHGKFLTWNWGGDLVDEKNYKDGKLDGIQKSWHNNLKKFSEELYKEGKRIYGKYWYDNGQLREEYFSEKDKPNKEWYKSGQIKKIDNRKGLKSWKCWDEEGNVKDCFKRVKTNPFD